MRPTKLSKNLSIREFQKSRTALRRNIDNDMPDSVIKNAKNLAENIFQPLREEFACPIYVSSGYRSKQLNEAIGGSEYSQHCLGEAMDIDMDSKNIYSSHITNNPDTTHLLKNKHIFHYIKDHLDFDQLIWEFGGDEDPAWVHVSYRSGNRNRNKILIAYRDDKGRVKYKNWDRG